MFLLMYGILRARMAVRSLLALLARPVPAAVAAPAHTAVNDKRINQSANSASLSVNIALSFFYLNPHGFR